MWLRAGTRAASARASTALRCRTLNNHLTFNPVRFNFTAQLRTSGDRGSDLSVRDGIKRASSYEEAKKLFLLQVERCGNISEVDPSTVLDFFLRLLKDPKIHSQEISRFSAGAQIALQKVSSLNGAKLGAIFARSDSPERKMELVPLISTIVERVSSGDVVDPPLSNHSVKFMLSTLSHGVAILQRAGNRSNEATLADASAALAKLAEYCQHMRPQLGPEAERAVARARGEATRHRADPVELLRQLFSNPSINSDSATKLSHSAVKIGKRSELFSLISSASWAQHDPSLLISPILSALLQFRDYDGIVELLRLLPFELTLQQSIFVTFAPFVRQTRSHLARDMLAQMFFRVWESFARGGQTEPVHPRLPAALDVLLEIAFKKQDASLARAVVEAASAFNASLNPSSVNNLLFLYLDSGLVDEALTILECAVDASQASDLSNTARLFGMDPTLSSVDMRVFQHFVVTMTKFELWSYSTRFVQLMRRLNQKLSDSFCAASFVEAGVAGADSRRRLVLCQFFIDLPELFVLTARTINAFIQEAGVAGRPDVCLQFAQELFNRFGVDQADSKMLPSIVRAFTLSGDDSLALRVMIMLRDSGVQLDGSLYNVILKMYLSRGDPRSFYDILVGMKASGVEPSRSMYVDLIDLCIQAKSPIIAEALEMAIRENVSLNLARLRASKEILRHIVHTDRSRQLVDVLSERIKESKLEKTAAVEVPVL